MSCYHLLKNSSRQEVLVFVCFEMEERQAVEEEAVLVPVDQ